MTVRLFLPPVEYDRLTSAASNGVRPILPRTRSSDLKPPRVLKRPGSSKVASAMPSSGAYDAVGQTILKTSAATSCLKRTR